MAHILIAEDDLAMQGVLKIALEKAGHTLITTSNGQDALHALETTTTPFDLLLTDIVMPGMDGIELAKKAEKQCPALKVMFITGFAAVALSDSATKDTKVLSKPFHLNDLVERVEALLCA